MFVGFVGLCELRCTRFELSGVLATGLIETMSSRTNVSASDVRRMELSSPPAAYITLQIKMKGFAFAIVSRADR